MRLSSALQSSSEFDALESSAQGARQALACPFSSSAEFEAELIRERRAAGAYRHLDRKGRLAGIATAVAALLVAFALI